MLSAPAYAIHHPQPFMLRLGEDFGIRYYGLAYVLGFLIAAALLRLYGRRGRSPYGPAAQGDLMFALTLGTFLGGRLGYFLFYAAGDLLHDPLRVLRVWEGGMSSHGGFIGVCLGSWWAARKHRIHFLPTADLVVTLAPAGVLLGRVANYLNGELWGRVIAGHVPWAVVFTNSEPPGTPLHQILPRHPSQLYEAALEGLLLLVLTQWRLWRTPVLARAPGRLAGEFLLAYAAVRIFCEQFREHDAGIPPVFGLNRGAWLSLALIAAGVVLVFTAARRSRTPTPPPSSGPQR